MDNANLASGTLLGLVRRPVPLVLRRGLEYVEEAFSVWAHFKDAGRVPAAVAIVRCRPYSREVIIK